MDNKSTKILSSTAPAALPTTFGRKTAENSAVAQAVRQTINGGSITRLSQTEPEKVALYLSIELEQVAKVYTGAPKTDASVYDEAVMFVINKFGFLAPTEIREAFQHAAASAPDILAAYYGQFTNAMLGRVLGAYCEQVRNQAAMEVAGELPAGEPVEVDYAALAEQTIARLCALEEVTFDSVNIGDYGILEKAGRLVLTTGQKWMYWGMAEQVTLARLHAAKNREANPFNLRKITQQIEEGMMSDQYRALREATAKRLAVVDFINAINETKNETDDFQAVSP